MAMVIGLIILNHSSLLTIIIDMHFPFSQHWLSQRGIGRLCAILRQPLEFFIYCKYIHTHTYMYVFATWQLTELKAFRWIIGYLPVFPLHCSFAIGEHPVLCSNQPADTQLICSNVVLGAHYQPHVISFVGLVCTRWSKEYRSVVSRTTTCNTRFKWQKSDQKLKDGIESSKG